MLTVKEAVQTAMDLLTDLYDTRKYEELIVEKMNTFMTEVEVRFNDIDAMGHVNNAVIFTYFEEGRKALFYSAFKKTAPGGFSFMVAHLECDYILPVRLEDRLLLKMSVTAIGNKSFGLSYELLDTTDADRVFARGSSVQVCYDYHQQCSIQVPNDLKKALSIYLNPVLIRPDKQCQEFSAQ